MWTVLKKTSDILVRTLKIQMMEVYCLFSYKDSLTLSFEFFKVIVCAKMKILSLYLVSNESCINYYNYVKCCMHQFIYTS